MKSAFLKYTVSFLALLVAASQVLAQSETSTGQPSPAAVMGGMAGGGGGDFSGYVPSAGMVVGGGPVQAGTADAGQADAGAKPAAGSQSPATPAGNKLPPLSDGHVVSREKVEGFNQAIEQSFPMTPEMLRRYRDIFEANERALQERATPEAQVDAGFISLEPGEVPSQITVAPGIASVLGFYDMTGQPWPIDQYVLGSGADFQVAQLGLGSNNVAVTPLARFGTTNLVIVLKDQPKPVVMQVRISEEKAHYRHDVQIMAAGPNASQNTAARDSHVTEAGSQILLAALSGVDLPASARSVRIDGVDARAWKVGERLFIRSKHALLSPSWLSSMSGPDGIRVYEITPGPVALFSVDGTIVRADVVLP